MSNVPRTGRYREGTLHENSSYKTVNTRGSLLKLANLLKLFLLCIRDNTI